LHLSFHQFGIGAVTEHLQKERPLGVLIVDNELAIAKLLDLFLTRKGFSVWMTSRSRQAVDLYREHMAEIDVVLSDVVMPGIDGLHLLTELRQLNPSLCFCFMTGESADYSPADLFATGANRVFPKPFPSLEEVATELRELVAAAAFKSGKGETR
jgi:CheY-like chemotaxis protein